MDLKSTLKNAKKLISSGEFEKAQLLLEELIECGEKDYLLYCFLALCYSEQNEINLADTMYGKAIEMDPKSLIAFQGLFKLYYSDKLKVDRRTLDVVNILLKDCDGEKKEIYKKGRRKFIFTLGLLSLYCKEDLIDDPTLISHILSKVIIEDKDISDDEDRLCRICFDILDKESYDEDTSIYKAIYSYKRLGWNDWTKCVFDSILVSTSNEWIRRKRREALASYYLMNGLINESWRQMIGNDDDILIRFIDSIMEGNEIVSSEIIESCKSDNTNVYFIVISLRFLIKDEEYEEVIERVDHLISRNKIIDDLIFYLNGIKAECLLRCNEPLKALNILPLPHPQFAIIEARILYENDRIVPYELIDSLNDKDKLKLEIWKEMKKNNYDKALEHLNELNDQSWEYILLKAQCLSSSSPSISFSLLVKTAQLNSRCSRSFYLLSIHLRDKNIRKAVSLAERAACIRNNNEDYTRLLYELKCEIGEDDNEQLRVLERYANTISVIPEWCRLSLSRLLINTNRIDEAIRYLQEGINEDDHSALRWSILGDAYCLRGQLSSSINAYEVSVNKEENLERVVHMLQVSLRLGDYSNTMQLSKKWMDIAHSKCSSSYPSIRLIYTQSVLYKTQDDISLVITLIPSIVELIRISPQWSITYKLCGDSMIIVSRCSSSIFSQIDIPSQWNIIDQKSCINMSIIMYSRAIEIRKDDASLWYDLSLSLLLSYKIVLNDKTILDKSRSCIIKSINVSSSNKLSFRSRLWLLLAQIEDSRNESNERIHHCLIRSIELDGKNEESWLMMALLYIKIGEMELANECIEKSTKWNCNLCQPWSVWSQMALSNGHTRDAEDMMRHSLSIRPTVFAMRRYTDMICDKISNEGTENWESSRLLIDMNKVMKLNDSNSILSEDDLIRLAILAELFGHYEEAKELHNQLGNEESIHSQRNILKYMSSIDASSSSSSSYDSLNRLNELCGKNSNELKDLLEKSSYIIDPNIKEVEEKEMISNKNREENDETEIDEEVVDIIKKKKNIYLSLKQSKLTIPLLVSAIINFKYTMEDDFIRSLHDITPRDELIDYFPTVIPDEIDNGIRYVEIDGEEPFRLHNQISHNILRILKRRRELLLTQ